MSIHGDGLQTRDFTYIDDAVEATLLAAIHPRAEGEVFNVGTGIETSVAELARMVGVAARRDVTIQTIDRRDIDNIRRRVVNIEKARRMLHWVPQVRMQQGLDRTAAWFESAGFSGGTAAMTSAARAEVAPS
jgi:UDP-glucose 4-epimerase